jgi:L-threonylcarbamoyladenylate synthase
VHYSPATAAYRFESHEVDRMMDWQRRHPLAAMVVLAINPLPGKNMIGMPAGAEDYARRLYAALHEADRQKAEAIWIELPPDEPRWQAVRDRLRRATRPAGSA